MGAVDAFSAEATRNTPASQPPAPPREPHLPAVLRLWQLYLAQLRAHPLRTKCATAATLGAVSDVLGSSLSGRSAGSRGSRLVRTLQFAAFGAAWSAPAMHYWQRFVERKFANWPPGHATFAAKVAFDQLLFGPASNLAFMAFLALSVERTSLRTLLNRVRLNFMRVQLAAYRFWPLVAGLNYSLVPPALRPLVANLAGLGWSTFLVLSSRRQAAAALAKAQ